MKKCPRDADYKKNEPLKAGCQSKMKINEYDIQKYCTRNLNHKNEHHHHDRDKTCIQTWTTEELIVESL